MALNHAFGVVQWLAADTVGTTYTVDLPAGFDLKAIRLYHSGQSASTDAVTSVVPAQVGLGFATGTAARRALVNLYNDGDTNNATGAGVRNDCVAMTVPASGAPLGLLDVSSFSAEQFVLRVDDQNTTSLTVAWEAWGGSDITVATVGDFGEPAATGVQSYSVTGFTAAGTDQVVMLAGNNITAALNTNQDAYGASIYCGYFTGSDSAQNVVVAISALEAANADTYRYCQTGECVATMTPTAGGVSGRAIGNFATDAFQLDWLSRSVTDRRSIFLAIKGGQWRAGAYTINGLTLGATATVSGLPFQPAGLDFIGTAQIQPTAGSSNALGRLSFGVAASTTSRQSMGVFANDGSANSEITLAIEYDQALVHVEFGAVMSAYDLSAINSDGFTVIVDDAGGPSTEWQGYLAFAGAVAGGASATAATAWRIRAAQQAGSAWRIRAAAPAATAWRVFGAALTPTAWRIRASAAAGTAWRVLASVAQGAAWRIRAAVQQATAWQILTAALAASVAIGWRIRTAAAAPTAWRVRTALAAGTAWRILAAAAAATAWRVFGAALAPTAWRIRASAAAGTAWRVLASAAQATAWRIRAAVQQATAWQILAAALAASVAIGWRIRTAAATPTAWRIRTALTAGTGWRIRQALAQALGWRIGALLLPAPHQVLQATRHARTLYATTHPRLLHARR